MKHLFIRNNQVDEIIPDENPIFPGVPIEERYSPDFLKQCVAVDDDFEVDLNWKHDPETDTFSPPPAPDIIEEVPSEEESVSPVEGQ